MPKPAVKVELGFGDNAPGNWFTLDSATRGLLDNTTYTLSGATYYDVTQYLVDVSTARGKSRELDRFNAGRVVAHFDNRNRYFDPTFAASPFYGQIVPRRDIRFSAGGTVQFTGITDDWNLTYSPDGASVAEVTGFDGFSLLASQKLAGGTATSQLSGARINAVLSDSNVNWSATSRLIDAGQETLQADVIPANQEVIPYINLVEQSEPGVFFLDKSNYATFKDRSTGAPTSGTWVPAGTRTNLVTNPSFEASSGTVTVRTNLITNPSFEVDLTSWNNAGAVSLTRVTTQQYVGTASLQVSTNADATGPYISSPATASTTYTASVWVKGTAGATIGLDLIGRTASVEVGRTSSGSITMTGNWQQISVTRAFGATEVIAWVFVRSYGATAQTFYVDAVMLEQSSVLGTYFDGSTTASGDFSYAWSGTANTSNSFQLAPALTVWGVNSATGKVYKSTAMPWVGSSNGAIKMGSTYTFADVYIGAGAGTYTFSCYVYSSASKIDIIFRDNSGASFAYYQKTITPNTWTRVSQTVTQTAAVAGWSIGWEQADATEGTIAYIDGAMVEQSSTLGNYFDGSFPNTTNADIYAWTGTANASTSTDTRNTFVPPTILADDGTGIGYTAVNVVYGSEQLYNQVTLVRNNGGTVTTSDATSQAAYGIRNVEQTGLLHTSDANTAQLASYLVNTYKNPEFRFESMDFILNDLSTANQTTLLGLEIGSVCKIVFTPNGIAPSIVKYAEVLGLNHTATTESHRMTIKFQTLDTTSFILDDLQFGLLDLNNLGY